MFNVRVVPTLTAWSVIFDTRNPVLLIETLKLPAGTSTRMNLPTSFVEAERVAFVDRSVSVTSAPATAAPDGSNTVPTTWPVEALCEKSADGTKASKHNRQPIIKMRRLLDI
jgi:hypothetical protein